MIESRTRDPGPFHRFFELISREDHKHQVAEKAFVYCIHSMSRDDTTIIYYLMLSWINLNAQGVKSTKDENEVVRGS